MQAASAGRIDVLRQCLLQPGFDINVKADDGFTALHCAARAGQTTAVHYLLRHRADSRIRSDNIGSTLPTHEAVLGKSLESFVLLVQAGAPMESADGGCRDMTDYIASSGIPPLAHYFIENGRVDIQTAVNWITLSAAATGHDAMIRSLVLSHPKIIQIATKSRQSPLYVAAKKGHLAVVHLLLTFCEAHMDYDEALSDLKLLSLGAAAKRRHLSVVDLLLRAGGFTADRMQNMFLDAVKSCELDIVQRLALECYQDKDCVDRALRLAVRRSHTSIVAHLAGFHPVDAELKRDTHSMPIIHLALSYGIAPVVETLLTHKNVNVNVMSTDYSALQRLVQGGRLEHIETLLRHPNVDVNQPCKVRGESALLMAVGFGLLEPTAMLLGHPSINVNAESADGRAPLHRAVERGNVEVLNLLLSHPNIDVNVRDASGESVLYKALRKDRWSFYRVGPLPDLVAQVLLRQKGIQIDDCDGKGNCAVRLAERYNHWSAFRILLQREDFPIRIWSQKRQALKILIECAEQRGIGYPLHVWHRWTYSGPYLGVKMFYSAIPDSWPPDSNGPSETECRFPEHDQIMSKRQERRQLGRCYPCDIDHLPIERTVSFLLEAGVITADAKTGTGETLLDLRQSLLKLGHLVVPRWDLRVAMSSD
jgi:ankyrin repeat protein